jgi:hypothetical protein
MLSATSPMTPKSPSFTRLKRRRNSLLPPAANVVSEGFIETVFFLLGIGILLPWNAYISAKQYFVSRICDEDPDLAQRIEMWFSILYNGACVVSLAVVIFVQYVADSNNNNSCMNKRSRSLFKSTSNLSIPMMCSKTLRVDATRASNSDGYTWYMVMVPLGVYLAVFFMTTVFVFVSSIDPHLFLILTFSGLFICGICTAIASSGIVGTAGLFDPNIGVNPYFNGQAAGGLLVACANFITSVLDGSTKYVAQFCAHHQSSSKEGLTVDANEESDVCLTYSQVSWATAMYFGMSCFILAACMVGYSYIDEYKHHVRSNSVFGDPFVNLTRDVGGDCQDDDLDDDDENPEKDDLLFEDQIQYLSIENVPQDEFGSKEEESTLSKWKRKALVGFVSYQNSSGRSPLENAELAPLRRESEMSGDSNSENTQSVTWTVWMSVRGSAASLFLTYFCTLVRGRLSILLDEQKRASTQFFIFLSSARAGNFPSLDFEPRQHLAMSLAK